MTKEIDLTTRGQNTYSENGDKYMQEPGNGEGQPVVNSPKQEAPKPVVENKGQQELIKEYFEKSNAQRVASGEKITPEELQTQRIMIENGIAPIAGGADVDPEEIIRIISEGGGAEFSPEDLNEALRATGFSEADIEGASREEKIAMLRAGSEGGEPPRTPPTAAGGNTGENEPPRQPERNLAAELPPEVKIQDRDISGLVEQANAGEQYGRTPEEKYNALREAAISIAGLGDRDVEEGSSSFAAQKTFARLALEQRMQAIAEESAKHPRTEQQLVESQATRLRGVIEGNLPYEEKLDQLEQIIQNELDPNERSYPHVIGEAIEGIKTREFDYIVEDVLEFSLEMFLNRADEQPLEDYPQLTFTESENVAIIGQAARKFDAVRKKDGVKFENTAGKREMFKYLTTLSNRRRIMHEIFKGMNDLESYTGLVTRALRKSGMAFVEKQLAGVSDVQVVYDQVLLSTKSLKPQSKGWLLEEDFDKADIRVRDIFADSVSNLDKSDETFNKDYIDGNDIRQTRRMRDWEISRAFHMGRDLSGAAQRRVIYGILGDVPKNADELLKSVAHEPIARRLAPLLTLPARFFNQPIAVGWLEILKHEQKRKIDGKIDFYDNSFAVRSKDPTVDNYRYGYVVKGKDGKPLRDSDGEPITRGFFGSSQGATSLTDLSITDPKSNSWRARLMFLKNPDFGRKVGERRITIGDYLDATKEIRLEELEHVKGRKNKHHHRRDLIKAWNKDIGGRLAQERFFLGIVMRYSDIDEANKAIIWQNTARLMPSRIASLFPNETLRMMGMQEEKIDKIVGQDGKERDITITEAAVSREKATSDWEKLAEKLWLAERMRLVTEAKAIRGVGDYNSLPPIENALKPYLDKVGITEAEMGVVEKLQDLDLGYQDDGVERDDYAKILAHGTFPFTTFIDDAPETDWERLSDYDFTRLLVNDQNSYQEGFGHIIGLADNPIRTLEETNHMMIEGFEKAKGPPGIERMQQVFSPIIRTTYRMRQMKTAVKWLGESLARMNRKPVSIMEEYNLSANIGDDESTLAKGLTALAQKDVISDDPQEADDSGRTPLFILRKDLDADRKDVALAYLRLLIQILGPVFAEEFIKALGLKL